MFERLPRPEKIYESQGCCPCAVCGRDVDEPHWAVHLILNGDLLMSKPGTTALPSGANDLGLHFVGDECRTRFGLTDWTEAV